MNMKIAPHHIKNLDDKRVPHGIEDLIARFAVDQDILRTEHGEMLRSIRLLDPEPFDQRPSRQLAVSQLLHNCDPRRVGEGLKKLSFELTKRILH